MLKAGQDSLQCLSHTCCRRSHNVPLSECTFVKYLVSHKVFPGLFSQVLQSKLCLSAAALMASRTLCRV